MTNALSASWVETPLGRLFVACSEVGVCFIGLQPDAAEAKFEAWRRDAFPGCTVSSSSALLTDAAEQLHGFATGERRSLDLIPDLVGTEFQCTVWSELMRIPFGATRTYGDVARSIGNPSATRAVGMANHRNPVPILVPCHRVVAANGMGGFGGGLEMKHRLLVLEGVHLAF